MTLHAALALSAVLAATWLFFTAGSRTLPLVAFVAAGVEVALAQGWVRLALHGMTGGETLVVPTPKGVDATIRPSARYLCAALISRQVTSATTSARSTCS